MRRLVILALALFSLLSTAVGAEEGGSYNPDPFNRHKKEDKDHNYVNTQQWGVEAVVEGVTGTVKMVCYTDDKDEFKMELKGLKPKSVYTVWFTTSLKETAMRAGLGEAPHSFKVGGGSEKTYQVPLSVCPLKDYKWLEVRLHPDGDPTNLAGSERVLKVRLRGH